jgi:hypothetical protein
MTPSHETCPICSGVLLNCKYLHHPCKIADNKRMSYIDSVCNDVYDVGRRNWLVHQFFQVTSLYGDCLFESITFVKHGILVEVNYIKVVSTITYSNSPKHSILFPQDAMQKLEFARILELDYPKLENLLTKTKSLAPFL